MSQSDGNLIDTSDLLRYLFGGAAAGLAVAGPTLLARELGRKKRERDQLKDEEASTLRFTLPKQADAYTKSENSKKVLKVEDKKLRNTEGKYDTMKRANWPTMASSILAAGAGGAGTYALANALYNAYQERKAQAELDEARSEYLNLLMPQEEEPAESQELDQHKLETTAEIIPEDDEAAAVARKSASDEFNSFNIAHAPGALAALLTLLGAGTTAYGVKSMLDDAHPADKPVGPSGVTRVVFDDPETEDYKTASADSVIGATAVMMDVISGNPLVTGHPEVASSLKTAGLTAGDLYKSAMVTPELLDSPEYKDTEQLLNLLERHKDVRRSLQRIGMNARPMLKHFKWTLDLPFVGPYADKKLYEQVALQGLNSNTSGLKYASDLLTAALAANITKDTISDNDERDRIADPDKPDVEDLRDATQAVDSHDGVFAKRVKVDAADPKAQEFLAENLQTILAALRDTSARSAAH